MTGDGSVIEGGKLGKYAITGTLGRGAMGTVYDGRDPVIDRRVAIKTIKLPDQADTEAQEELARFRREAQAAGRLHHPNIVGIFDYGETETIAYIVMEFVDGTSLKQMLDKQERFSPADSARLLTGLLAGLEYSHREGVVHRDIKPANVMITRQGTVKIADFGIARIESSSLTQAGTIMGTPAYMSPEQFMGVTVDARTDLYSAGVVLYQMLTGERPFEGSMTAIMHKALNTVPPRPSALSVTAPAALDAVVERAMAKRPEDRFADAAAFAEALRVAMLAPAPVAPVASVGEDATMVARPSAARPPPIAAPPPPVVAAKRGPPIGLIAGAAVLVLAVGGGGAYVLLGQAPAPPPAPIATIPTPAPMAPMAPLAPPTPLAPPAPLAPPRPVATPAPAPDPRPAATQAIAAVIASTPCALLGGEVHSDGTITLRGLLPKGGEPQLLSRARAAVSQSLIDDQALTFTGPYCDLLDVLRPAAPAFGQHLGGLELGLENGARRLRKDEYIVPRVHVLDHAAVLQVDYFSSDGTLTHMHQPSDDKARPTPADGVLVLHNGPSSPTGWQVTEPFGTDLLVALATDTPLFAAARPDSESAADYLRDLRTAIAAARARGGRVEARAIVLETTK